MLRPDGFSRKSPAVPRGERRRPRAPAEPPESGGGAARAAPRRREPLPPSGGRRGGGTHFSGARSRRLSGADRNRGTKQKVSQKNPPRSPVHIVPSLVSEGNPRARERVFVRRGRGRWFSAPRRCGAVRSAQRRPGRAAPQPPRRRGPARPGDRREAPPPPGRAREPTEIKLSI